MTANTDAGAAGTSSRQPGDTDPAAAGRVSGGAPGGGGPGSGAAEGGTAGAGDLHAQLAALRDEVASLAKIIGIDLGTTNSCVAALERGGPNVLASREGERTIPSVVAFLSSGRVVVGVPAKRQAVTNATSTIHGAKRLIGRKVNAPDVERFARSAPFSIVAAHNGDAWVRLPLGRDVSPQEVSAYVLERMRDIAQQSLGEPVTQAVITVPAYFNDAQRQATKDAGRIAGLDVRRILNEPTAAALAYGVHRRKSRQRLAVFDFGGGTFDVSILTVDRGVFEVLAVNGNASLGGDDFDQKIIEWICDEFLVRAGH